MAPSSSSGKVLAMEVGLEVVVGLVEVGLVVAVGLVVEEVEEEVVVVALVVMEVVVVAAAVLPTVEHNQRSLVAGMAVVAVAAVGHHCKVEAVGTQNQAARLAGRMAGVGLVPGRPLDLPPALPRYIRRRHLRLRRRHSPRQAAQGSLPAEVVMSQNGAGRLAYCRLTIRLLTTHFACSM